LEGDRERLFHNTGAECNGQLDKDHTKSPCEDRSSQRELADYPLRIGLSMFATVDTKKTKGTMTPPARSESSLFFQQAYLKKMKRVWTR
jgi:hypothetical protein